MKIRLYNFDPLKPIFYIIKLRFTGVYIIFLISTEKTLIVGTRKNRLPTIYVLSRNMKKYQNFYPKTQFLVVKFSICLHRRVFIMSSIRVTESEVVDTLSTLKINEEPVQMA